MTNKTKHTAAPKPSTILKKMSIHVFKRVGEELKKRLFIVSATESNAKMPYLRCSWKRIHFVFLRTQRFFHNGMVCESNDIH